MVNRKLFLAALVLLPSIATAQRGGGGGGKTRGDVKENWNDVRKGDAGLKLSNKDVEETNPVGMLLEKRGDLKLTDAQTGQMKDLDKKAAEKNESLFKALDSLRVEMKPPARPSDDDAARMINNRAGLRTVLESIRGNYDEALNASLALFDESQKKTAADLLRKHNDEAEAMMREKVGGRR